MNRGLPKGVYKIKGVRGFRATIWDENRKTYQVGTFDTAREAHYYRLLELQEHHWECPEGVTLNPKTQWGFTYLITNRDSGKMYVGKKQYRLWQGPPGGYKCTDPNDTKWFDESVWGPNDWETYMGSSKKLTADIENPWDWKFEVLSVSRDILSNHLSEVNEMLERNVLEALDTDGNYLYYNENIASMAFRAPFLKEDMADKKAKSLEALKMYYLKPKLCPSCTQVVPFPGTQRCDCQVPVSTISDQGGFKDVR